MNFEEPSIAKALAAIPSDHPVYLATVIAVTGSAYRRPGAKLLFDHNRIIAGNVSSGCIENDLQERVRHQTMTEPVIVTYDTTTEDDLLWGSGVGCGGVARIFVEPLSQRKRMILQRFWETIQSERRVGWLLTAVAVPDDSPVSSGDVVTLIEQSEVDGTVVGKLSTTWIESLLEQARQRIPVAIDRNSAQLVEAPWEDQQICWLVERVPPPFPLVIFGADVDVPPVVQLADRLGWEVTVVDHRLLLATPERFPTARLVHQEPEQYLKHQRLPHNAAVLLMTHHYLRDQQILSFLVSQAERIRYCGIIGPRKRTRRLLAELRDTGVSLQTLEPKLYFPTGLDIASETAEEIAISVIAEILAVLRGRSGGHLRVQQRSIHS